MLVCLFVSLVNLRDLINVQRDYQKVYNDKNPALFDNYASALTQSGASTQDYFQHVRVVWNKCRFQKNR